MLYHLSYIWTFRGWCNLIGLSLATWSPWSLPRGSALNGLRGDPEQSRQNFHCWALGAAGGGGGGGGLSQVSSALEGAPGIPCFLDLSRLPGLPAQLFPIQPYRYLPGMFAQPGWQPSWWGQLCMVQPPPHPPGTRFCSLPTCDSHDPAGFWVWVLSVCWSLAPAWATPELGDPWSQTRSWGSTSEPRNKGSLSPAFLPLH